MNKKILAFVADLPVLHEGRGNRPEDRAVNLVVGQNPQFNCKATQADLSASECAGRIRMKLPP